MTKKLSTHRSVLALADLLLKHSIRDVVICPGSRNAPLAQTFSQLDDFNCFSVVDERSAGFFALGLALKTGKPTVVCCTSGTALLNLASAAAEAYYQGVPLIIISADRPDELIDQLHDQTIRQPEALRSVVKKAVHIPESNDLSKHRYAERLINDALSLSTFQKHGPVHINVPLSEPLFDFSAHELPDLKPIKRLTTPADSNNYDEMLLEWQRTARRLIVLGQGVGSPPCGIKDALEELIAKDENTLFVAEHLSGLSAAVKERSVAKGLIDELLHAADDELQRELSPDLLVTMGNHTLSKQLKKWLAKYPPNEHWSFSPDGELHDTYGCLTQTIAAGGGKFLKELSQKISSVPIMDEQLAYTKLFRTCEASLQAFEPNPNIHWTDIDVLGAILKIIPPNSSIIAGNSSTVRNLQRFSLPINTSFYSNRGTSGIDGTLSTAVGFAEQSDTDVFCILGDLSFFYDMNALWDRRLSPRLTIILMNNGGGQIFHGLTGLRDAESMDAFVSHKHATNAEAWAKACGLDYIGIRSATEFDDALPRLAVRKECDPPARLFEVFTETESNIRRLKAHYNAQLQNNPRS